MHRVRQGQTRLARQDLRGVLLPQGLRLQALLQVLSLKEKQWTIISPSPWSFGKIAPERPCNSPTLTRWRVFLRALWRNLKSTIRPDVSPRPPVICNTTHLRRRHSAELPNRDAQAGHAPKGRRKMCRNLLMQ